MKITSTAVLFGDDILEISAHIVVVNNDNSEISVVVVVFHGFTSHSAIMTGHNRLDSKF